MGVFDWLKRHQDFVGAAYFPGRLLAPPEQFFAGLAGAGIRIERRPAGQDEHWRAELQHPQWGTADLAAPRQPPLPPPELFEFAFISTSRAGRQRFRRSAQTPVPHCRTGNLLRDRKLALRFLHAALASDGVVAIDRVSQRVWTPSALEDELAHDADLDVEGIYELHAVRDEQTGNVSWVHTHGLGEIGFLDFDILDPSPDFQSMSGMDVIRAMAFAILEGSATLASGPVELVTPAGSVSLVDVAEFLATGPRLLTDRHKDRADENHRRNRAVLCDPGGSRLFGRLFARGAVPSRFLSGPIPDTVMINFSASATRLAEERARGTYGRLRRYYEEFSDFGFVTIVKLGIPTDRDPGNKEHMWFEVHHCGDDWIDATLGNQPYYVTTLKCGERRRHSVDLLSDWMIMTPVGTINPRNTKAAREVRANPDEVRRIIAESEKR